ncbi:MAG: hypothetical protein E7430_05425 [Ruminococcaceae bacterium]|nr:hypothetical protein [Oscillospiraceae bacterium]
MEYFWYVLAALGAGVGTGLAGLSAATVMVPMLLVLCPSFSGDTGAYQATAVALASDILGSAVTTTIYIRHKNIDLKHGWIMLVCIVSMCILGSAAAWKAGNVVLGAFSLFLTFFIGIRFLVKPDTQRDQTMGDNDKLGVKQIIVSLFFGLTIGFGTGFFGSGGGMMMLVVFTAFLSMDMKKAVGTSTLIMTFTAIIASVSHIVIEPAIVLQRYDALLVCIPVATFGSVVSARFANKVNTKTVGLVTGAVLTVLGAAMLMIYYWNIVSKVPFVSETLICLGKYCVYIAAAVTVLLAIRFGLKPPRELFRKLLHLVAFASSVVLAVTAEHWVAASAASLVFAVVIYPAIAIFEKYSWFADLLVQRKAGEIKKSLVLLFAMMAVLIAFGWGVLGQRWLAVTAILMWGTGDAAAALCGKKFGKHHVAIKGADPKKTWEGSIAMAAASFVIGMLCLLLTCDLAWYRIFAAALITAVAGAFTELLSHGGNDTVTVPSVNILILAPLILL